MTESGPQFGTRLFQEADQAWQAHLSEFPEQVGDILQYFDRLRLKALGIDEEADRQGMSHRQEGGEWRREAKEAFRAAAEASVDATIAEWEELADRDHDIFEGMRENFVPAASHALIFPNDPPASQWDRRMYALLYESFQRLGQDMGLDVPDREPPKRAAEPPAHLNRHERRAWKKQNRKAAA